ncbi:MAG: hypothetical protein U0271_34575 [Polyangiaceae bacterium]
MSDPTASPHERAPGYATPSYATTARAASAHPSTAVLAYAEGLLRGRRIAVLGEATHDTAEKVIERGARLVHVYDPDPARVAVAMAALAAHAGRGAARPVIAQLTDDLGVRDGAFDVVLVPDLTLFEDAGAVVRRVRRLLSPQGVGIFASPNPDAKHALYRTRSGARSVDTALSYYDLYDAVSLQFPEVRMLGQAPFVGYAIVDFAEQNPDVAVDTTAVDEPAAPEWYVAIASQRRVELDAYSLVELPLDDVIGREPSQEPVTVPREAAARDLAASAATALHDRQVELTEAKARIAVLLSENETLREQVTQLARAERTAELANARLLELERDAAFLAGRTNAAEAARDEARLRAETAEALVERERARLTST